MSVQTDKGGAASLAFGDILTAEEPVWVWDIGARRILWANSAGRAFWGAETLEDLRARRFDPRNKALTRMAERAATSREWTDTLTLPGSGKPPVTCLMQTMDVAGGRPGLLVRALDTLPARAGNRIAMSPPAPVPENAADTAAMKRIGARVKSAQASRRANAKSPSAPPPSGIPPSPIAEPPEAGLSPAMLRELCHELRNPLTVILGFAERIRDSDPVRARGKIKGYAENILEGAHFAMEILADFTGRIREGGSETPAQAPPADVGAAVSSSLRLVAPLAKQAGMSLSKSIGRTLPRLRMEERALKQILLNVLVNAVRHQKTGGRIAVTARMRRDRSLLLTISDDGIGMTKKEIRAALGARPEAPAKTTSGSGLGLPLVKRLVESAGGAIAIESARRKGTAVVMTFPPESLVR